MGRGGSISSGRCMGSSSNKGCRSVGRGGNTSSSRRGRGRGSSSSINGALSDGFWIHMCDNEQMNNDFDIPNETLIMKVGEEKEIGKQGLKKKLVKDGEAWDTPDNGDKVEGVYLRKDLHGI
ncbi:Peptidyl-prolyl cis-trans isomerase FKBP65 [Camellia lanceoleosa]|uniref:Peptidyl-prolyl cis-trans isomerase FKBP65 n=1 Tax=Camellia lanceoleosa TaxID=1840588 RepID=A0ACC0I546_9ERIC|nr:Peptidyl-prolyl cis-trans isomerase FKBP65 [Camellia lanceoleosa]